MDDAPEKMDYSLIISTILTHRKSARSIRKTDGFPGQRLAVVHPPQRARASHSKILQTFCPTDIGRFCTAEGHERSRPKGVSQTIFIFCVRGTGWCGMAGVRHSIRANDLLILPAGRPHHYGAGDSDPWTIEWFHATGSGVSEYLKQLGAGRRSPVLSLRPGMWDSSLFGQALNSLEGGFADTHLLHAALSLGHLLGRIMLWQKEGQAGRFSVTDRLEKVATHLRENPTRPMSVSLMAQMAGLSRSHFSALFFQHSGLTPMDYLIRARISQACRLLDLTGLGIHEVAAKVGYADPYYFSRAFKKVAGCSPKAYRAVHKG